MEYPAGITFSKRDDGVWASYDGVVTENSLDIWAIIYLLNENFFSTDKPNIIHLEAANITVGLRLYFLADVFKNIAFDPKKGIVREKVEDLLNNIGAKYLTYDDKDDSLSYYKAKPHSESLVEENILQNLPRLFKNEFSESARLIRQFPAHIFEGKISEVTQVAERLWINALTVNKLGQLSIIDLEAEGNYSADALVRAIDYAIFCHFFKERVAKYWPDKSGEIIKNKIAIYCIAKKFHYPLGGKKGVKSLIIKNTLCDIIFIELKVKDHNLINKTECIFNTRKL